MRSCTAVSFLIIHPTTEWFAEPGRESGKRRGRGVQLQIEEMLGVLLSSKAAGSDVRGVRVTEEE